MNHEILFNENTFQKTLMPSRNEAVSKNNRSAFTTQNSEQSDQQKFAEYLNANKRAHETEKAKQSSSESKSTNETETKNSNRFATQEAKIHGEVKTSVGDADFALLDIANITALQAEIQRIIESQSGADGSNADVITLTGDGQITIDANNEDDAQKIDSLFALIASFLNEDDEGDASSLAQNNQNQDIISLLGKIQDALENGDIPSLTSGLTIEQLTALDENLDAYIEGKLSEKEEEVLEALAAQWITLAPPAAKTDTKAKSENVNVKADLNTPVQQSNDSSAKAIMTEDRHYTQSRYDTRYTADTRSDDMSTDTDQTKVDFKATMKAEGGQTNPQVPADSGGAAQRFLQSSASLPPVLDGIADQTQPLGAAQTGLQNSVNNPLTSVITQSQNATQAHPATQMVSATIQKAMKAGEDTNIKLRLDPPELGRVEVKMSIDKDNVAKIVLTAEKPETFMMLQKDSHVLQQALTDSGLDMQGDISFELASDSQDFGRDDGQHNNGNGSGRGKSGDDDGMAIETTMNWHVDPNTGHMHYNILA